MKRMTRRQVDGWFLPIRAALNEMLSGEVDSIRGYVQSVAMPSPGYTEATNTSALIFAWPVSLACSVASSQRLIYRH